MSLPELCQKLHAQIGALFTCEIREERLRVRTPYLYPDGDAIDLYFREQEGLISISDLGETTRWLHMQSTSLRRSPKQKALIEDICQTHGVEFYKGVLVARCRQESDLAATSLRVAQAALRVSDLWFTFRNRLVQSLADDVADLFTERQIPFERGEKLVGRSGKVWMPDFHVRTLRRSSIVCVLDTGNKSMARNLVSQVYTTYADLNHLAAGQEALKFVSLFDDTTDVWEDADFKLVEQVSEIARWSAPDAFVAFLEAA